MPSHQPFHFFPLFEYKHICYHITTGSRKILFPLRSLLHTDRYICIASKNISEILDLLIFQNSSFLILYRSRYLYFQKSAFSSQSCIPYLQMFSLSLSLRYQPINNKHSTEPNFAYYIQNNQKNNGHP